MLVEEVIFTAPPAVAVELEVLIVLLLFRLMAPPADIFTGLLVAVMVVDAAWVIVPEPVTASVTPPLAVRL